MGKTSDEMTFWDHLDVLRGGLIRSLLVLAVVSVVLFFFKSFFFDGVILAPTRSDFILYRLLGIDVSLDIINIDVTAQFITHMKVTFICALILCCPYLICEIWRCIAPALYRREKRAVG